VPTVTFPDQPVGTLSWPGSWEDNRGPVIAGGRVDVPEGLAVSLDVAPVADAVPSDDASSSITITVEGQQPVAQTLRSWTVNVRTDASVDLAFLESIPPGLINRLTLSRSTQADSLRHLPCLADSLAYLYLAATDLDDAALPHVAELTALVWLQSWGNRFTDSGVQQLASLMRLRWLYLEEETLTVDAFAFTTQLPSLEIVGCSDTDMTSKDLKRLQSKLPGVQIRQ
jgi:hypothetical protein